MKNPFVIAALARSFAIVLALAVGWSGDALADDKHSNDADDELPPAAATQGAPLVSVDLHGRMRMRGNYFRDASLGNGTSGVPGSLSTADQNAGIPGLSPSDSLAMGDLRFRLAPTIHVGSRAAVHAQLDVAGAAMVLGSNPRDESLLQRTVGFSGNGPTRSGIGVRRLWADVDLFGMARLQLGRVGDHFGLGILRNDGGDRRADFQSDIDRAGVTAELFDFRFRLARDVLGTMPHIPRGPGSQEATVGLLDSGDVIRWLAEIGGGAATGAGFGWGAAVSYQSQTSALSLEHDADFTEKIATGCVENGTCLQVEPRDATLIMPQGYVRYERKFGLGLLRAEGELALMLGTMANTDSLAATDTSKTILAGGFAGKLSLQRGTATWKLLLGAASGDSEGGFGVLDQHNLTVDKGGEAVHRTLLTGFRFHRGFLVDGLMFREIIGAVANAWFARPAWRTSLATTGRLQGAWVEVGCLAGLAFASGATPGRARLLGVEPDVLVGYDPGAGHSALLHATWLLPGGAFDAGEGGAGASDAWRVTAEWHVEF